MATNNSNFVSINSLPGVQVATGNDLFILQTQNGTQTISFNNLNVIKTDTTDSALISGGLSAARIAITDATVGNNFYIDGSLYSGTERKEGTQSAFDYYNRFEVTNGIITSSDYVIGSPEYQTLFNLYQAISANSNVNYKKVFEFNAVASIPPDEISSPTIIFGGFPKDSSNVSIGNYIGNNINYASYFSLTPFSENNISPVPLTIPTLSSFNYNPGTGNSDDYISFNVSLNNKNLQGSTIKVGVRVLYFYS